MSNVPADLRYTREHEWCKVENGKARIGITAFAQEQLGDVVFVELPKVGATVAAISVASIVSRNRFRRSAASPRSDLHRAWGSATQCR